MSVTPINLFGYNNNISNLISQTFPPNTFGSSSIWNVYNGVNTATSTSPLNLLTQLTQTSQTNANNTFNMQNFNRTELALRTAVAPLNTATAGNAFALTTTSSKPTAVTATAAANATPGSYNVAVTQTAAAQTTTGTALTAATPAAITTGVGGFGQIQITTGGKTQLVSFKLNGGETNQQALNIIAKAVNSTKAGVTATVNVNAVAGTASLNLQGQTGVANGFTVADSFGNAAVVAGINNPANITQTARSAQFTVNGAAFTTATNTTTLSNTGLNLTINGTTGVTPATIAVQASSTGVDTAVRGFVSTFNSTLTTLRTSGYTAGQQSASTLQGAALIGSAELRKIGITVSAAGNLTINEATFKNAVQTNPAAVGAAFNNVGFAGRVQSEAERAISSSTALASSFSGAFANVFSATPTYGQNINQLIASNFGLFINQTL